MNFVIMILINEHFWQLIKFLKINWHKNMSTFQDLNSPEVDDQLQEAGEQVEVISDLKTYSFFENFCVQK